MFKFYGTLALIGLILAGIVFTGYHFFMRPVDTIERGLPTLQGRGAIPHLHVAMASDGGLRSKVEAFCNLDEATLFFNKKTVDDTLIAILFDWAEIDTSQPVSGKTREGLHPHVDAYLRRAYDLSPQTIIINNPLLGDNPWQRIFLDYKYKLIAQCAGRAAFASAIEYDFERNILYVTPPQISDVFLQNYALAVQNAPDKKYAANTLLSFIDRTIGLKNLTPQQAEMVQGIISNK